MIVRYLVVIVATLVVAGMVAVHAVLVGMQSDALAVLSAQFAGVSMAAGERDEVATCTYRAQVWQCATPTVASLAVVRGPGSFGLIAQSLCWSVAPTSTITFAPNGSVQVTPTVTVPVSSTQRMEVVVQCRT